MPNIPKITRNHVLGAVREITTEGVPARRASTRFCLALGERHFAPKYVVGVASARAAARPLRPQDFSGGDETNNVLKELGFEVVACPCGGLANREVSAPAARTPVVRRSRGAKSSESGEPDPTTTSITRLVVQGAAPKDPRLGERMLFSALAEMSRDGSRTKFLITPGGFLNAPWPRSWKGASGWLSGAKDIRPLIESAEAVVESVLSARVLRAAKGVADVITVGVDLHSGSDWGSDPHAELVAVYDVARESVAGWTGKSYPVGVQEHSLVHVSDLNSHCMEIADERVLVLGCHDLNLFSPRAFANQSADGPRRARTLEMASLVEKFDPTIVLQHPHTTDTPRIWSAAWGPLTRSLPALKAWASGIGYFNHGRRPRAALPKVLAQTSGGSGRVRDIVLQSQAD